MSTRPYDRKWFVVLGHPIHRTEFIRLCTFTLLCVFFVVGLVLYLYADFVTENREEKVLKELHMQSVEAVRQSGMDPFDLFMTDHLDESGFGEINSLQLNGTFRIGKQVFDLSLFSKRPNLCKVQLQWPEGVACSGFDGTDKWAFSVDSFVEQFALPPEILNPVLSQFLATVLAGEWMYSKSIDEPVEGEFSLLSWEPKVEWQGRECNQLVNRGLGVGAVFHYFDLQYGSEICREARVFMGGVRRHIMLYYSKPMQSGYPLPSGFELWIDGRMQGRAEFTHCEVNRGLMDYLFSRPEKPKDEEMYAPLRLSGSTGY